MAEQPSPKAEQFPVETAEASPVDATFVIDGNKRIVSWPASAESLYGFPAEEMMGEPMAILSATDVAMDRETEDVIQEVSARDRGRDGWQRRTDDSLFWASVTIAPVANPALGGRLVMVTDRTTFHQSVKQLFRQNDRLKEFSEILVHDLRNPLNVMLSRVELARRSDDPKHLDALEETVERMDRLVDDLLALAREGNPVDFPEQTDVDAIVERAWEGTGGDEPRAVLDAEPMGTIVADGDRLGRLFENLFRNAIEHAGPAVVVRVGPLEDGFFVEDDGSGIDTDDHEKVFRHGYSGNPEGSGYGLSIVRTIAGAHGWDISLADNPDGGARFEITGVDRLD